MAALSSRTARQRLVCCFAALQLLGLTPAAAQLLPSHTLSIPRTSPSHFDWGLSTGLNVSAGNYGAKCAVNIKSVTCNTTGTTLIELPMTVMLQAGRLRMEVTASFINIQGPGKISDNYFFPVVMAPSATEPKHRSGLGDFTIGGAWLLHREDAFVPAIEIGGIAKLPTASSGLGTGKGDFGAQLNLYRTLTPWLTAYGSLGYLWIGDINTVKLHSGAHATAGVDVRIASFGGGAMLDLQQSTWQGAPDYASLNPYFTWHFLGGVGVTLYTTIGLTRASPSHGFGVRLSL